MIGIIIVTYKFNMNGTMSEILSAKRGIKKGDPISPFLFLLVMEYLHSGDEVSVKMMMGAFSRFTKSTGLVANPSKSKMLIGGLDSRDRERLRSLTNFQEGGLPVRYLGVPLTNKKITTHAYMPLVEKITGRMQHWTTRVLSYAGKIQLVRSISYVIAQYWVHCFPILKLVSKKIDAIFRSFIWIGNSEMSRKSPVAWNKVCSTAKQGGL
ncbi:unnamed protein product [Lathyrus sativus]|nr:unnamed protein product [Lathyrus sativus]